MNKSINKIGLTNLVILILVIGFEIYNLIVSDLLFDKVSTIIHLIAYAFGLYYAFTGYKKKGAEYHMTFMYTFFISAIISLIGLFVKPSSILVKILSAIACLLVLCLCSIKNLGKAKSIAISLTIIVLYGIQLIVAIGFTNEITTAVLNATENIVLGLVSYLFILGKYEDKDERGTK